VQVAREDAVIGKRSAQAAHQQHADHGKRHFEATALLRARAVVLAPRHAATRGGTLPSARSRISGGKSASGARRNSPSLPFANAGRRLAITREPSGGRARSASPSVRIGGLPVT